MSHGFDSGVLGFSTDRVQDYIQLFRERLSVMDAYSCLIGV